MISDKARGMSSPHHIMKSVAGQDSEQRFYDSCRALKKDIKKTKKNTDIYSHTDFIVDGESYDVKGIKQTQKEGKILLELKNVKGELGWCNDKGTPEWIAFDYGHFFLCAKNKDLYRFTQTCEDLNVKVKSIGKALYKSYTRKDRKDQMTVIYLYDVLNTCDHWFLPYKENRAPMEEYEEPKDLL